MADQVTTTFTANTQQLESALQSVLDRVQKLEGNTAKAGQELDKFSQSGHNAAAGVEKLHGHTEGLHGAMQTLTSHTGMASEVLERFGVEAGGAAKGLGFLTEMLESVKAAALPLLAIGAALAVVGAGVAALKEGVGEAGAVDLKLDMIANSARNAGADFGKSREDVKQWGEELSDQTGAPITSLLAGVQRMVAAHIDLHTAMILTADAEKIAIASGRDQTEVETALQQAILGRTRGLVAMGIITKEEAKNGVSLAEVNDRIEKQTRGAIELYQNSLPGALSITGNQIKELLKDLGEDTGLVKMFVDILKWVQSLIPTFKEWAETGIGNVKSGLAAMQPWLAPLGHLLQDVWAAVVKLWPSFVELGQRIAVVAGVIGQVLVPVIQFLAPLVSGVLESVVELFKTALDTIIGTVDFFIGVFTGDWSKFGKDCYVIADDFLGALNALFKGHLSNIVGGIGAAFDYLQSRAGAAMTVLSGLASHDPATIGAGIAGLSTGPSITDFYNSDKQRFESVVAQVHKGAAPNGHATEIHHGAGKKGGDLGTIRDQTLGGGTKKPKTAKTGGGPSTTTISLYEHYKEVVDTVAEAQKRLELQLGANDAAEAKLKSNIALATTEAGKRAAQSAYESQVQSDLYNKLNLLDSARATEIASIAQTKDAKAAEIKTHDGLVDSYNKLKAAQGDHTAQLTDLENKIRKSDDTIKAYDKTIKENEVNLAKNGATHKHVAQQIEDFATAVQRANAAASIASEKFYAKQAELQAEELATAGLTNAQKYDYYKKLYDGMASLAAAYKANNDPLYADEELLAEATYTKMAAAYKASLADQVNAHKAAVQKMTAEVTTFLDDVIVKHKSFADILKGIYDQILQAFIAMVAKMIVESALFKTVFGNLAGGIGGGLFSMFGGGGGGGGSALSVGNVGALAATGAPQSFSLLPGMAGFQAGGNNVVDLGASSIKMLTGSSSGVSPFSSGSGGFSITNLLVAPGGGVTALGGIAGAGLAAGGGALGASLTHGNQTNGMIGGVVAGGALAAFMGSQVALASGGLMAGGLSGGLAALLSGPAGIALLLGAGLLGGAVGGMFGPHLNANTSPDIFKTGEYGQAMANMGSAGLNGLPSYMANGQSFNEDPTLAAQLGGKGQISYIADYIKAHADAAKTLTPEELQYFSNATAMNYKAGGNVDLGNGQLVHWDTLSNAANDAAQKILALGGAAGGATTPIYSLTRMAPDFNQSRMGTWDPNGGKISWGELGRGGGLRTPEPVQHVTVNVNGVVGNIADVANEIQKQLNRNSYLNRFNQNNP